MRGRNDSSEEATYSGVEPATGGKSPVDCLAENIDWLEHHIDTYGSIVAKQPDIWGEARLTKYRDEYERIMFQELTNFHIKINGSIAQQDSAFLAQALALAGAAKPTISAATDSVAANSEVVAQLKSAGQANQNPVNGTAVDTFTHFKADAASHIELEPVIGLDQLSHYLDHLHDLRRINEGDDTSDSPGYSLNLVRIPVSILPGKLTRTGFGAEITITATPVITDDLMPTTFHNLAVNDVVELMGLPLVRITEADAYGALKYGKVLKDFNQDADAIECALRNKDMTARLGQITRTVSNWMQDEVLVDAIIASLKKTSLATTATTNPMSIMSTRGALVYEKAADAAADASAGESVGSVYQDWKSLSQTPIVERIPKSDTLSQARVKAALNQDPSKELATTIEIGPALLCAFEQRNPDAIANILNVTNSNDVAVFKDWVTQVSGFLRGTPDVVSIVPTGRARRELNPLNPPSTLKVFGFNNLRIVSQAFWPAYNGRYIRWKGGEGCAEAQGDKAELRVDLLDAQRFLQAELEAAHELLSQPEYIRLFAKFAATDSDLAHQIRAGHLEGSADTCPSVEKYRRYFFHEIHERCQTQFEVSDQPRQAQCLGFAANSLRDDVANSRFTADAKTSVEALAWMLVVESALLNDRLNLDVRKVAKSKDVPDLNTSRDYMFFLPEVVNGPNATLPELQEEFMQATEIFKKYVVARWPIHVFAIDPQEQDQNIADVSARKRELQFALAVGFVSGQIGANSLTQYSRNLQTQIETVSLNQTIVGFGHNDDTFGWRFFPRVQALPVPGTLGAIKETICGVSRDNDLRHRQLEPGQRECTAVVLMPSFVPYADFDVRSNWFALTNPKNAAITMKDAVHLSRAITTMRNSQAYCSKCACLYRDNEVSRLLKRVDQLDHELPLQTMRQLVPYGNTLGGFEMFNTGVTGLAPELIGWYGAPGINVDNTGSNTFMCGCTRPCSDSQQVASIVSAGGGIYATSGVNAQPLPICEGEGTTLFLVGNNFSVNDTKVIAGGVCIPHVQLVSRSIMRVTIPSCVQTEKLCENDQENEYVAVYVATPYGVTNHLHVPTNRTRPPGLEDQIELTAKEPLTITVTKADKDLKYEYASIPEVHLRVKDWTGLGGKTATLKAVPYLNGHYTSLPTDATGEIPIDRDRDFPAAGADADQQKAVLGLIKDAVKDATSPNPFTLRLYYEAFVNGSDIPVRLQAPVNVIVTLPPPDDAAKKAEEDAAAKKAAEDAAAAKKAADAAAAKKIAEDTAAAKKAAEDAAAAAKKAEEDAAATKKAAEDAAKNRPDFRPPARPAGSDNGDGSATPPATNGTSAPVSPYNSSRPNSVAVFNAFSSEPAPNRVKSQPNVSRPTAEDLPAPSSNDARSLRTKLQPMPEPTRPVLKPANTTGVGGCGCGLNEPAGQPQRIFASQPPEPKPFTAYENSVATKGGQQNPVRLVSATSQLPQDESSPPEGSNSQPSDASNGSTPTEHGPTPAFEHPLTHFVSLQTTPASVDENLIESRLDAIAKKQAEMQSQLQGLAATSPTRTAVAGQSVINVSIQQPKGVCARLFDNIETPILHRAFVKTRECWRNVRDQLPCGN